MKKIRRSNKLANWFSISIVLYLLVASQCTSEKKESSEAFVPNPVKMEKQEPVTLKIGEAAPDFLLPDTEGRFYSLNDFNKARVLVIVFSCNHCPTAQAYEDRMMAFTSDYKDKGVATVVISAASVYGLLPEEQSYTDVDDSYESMQIRAKDKGFNFPYLYDGDNHTSSIKYGPTATPHAFVFNKERKLEYVGRIDGSEKPGSANAEDLRAAVDAVLKGETPEVTETKAFGCSTKWAWRNELAKKGDERWAANDVTLQTIDVSGIEELKNNATEKLRLINVWASWCGPCVVEYPDLVTLQRNYGARSFEFTSISADDPKNEAKVLEFLQMNHSAVKNYIFDDDDKYALIEAIDPEWNGALPYTLLLEPGGQVIYSHQGEVDFLELKKVIVDHPLHGRYY